jgi:hypothetical protein
MVPATRRRAVLAVLCAVAIAAVSGCGGGGGTAISTPTTSATAMSSPGGETYASEAFVLPLTITVDPALKTPPSLDSRNLLSWDAAASNDNKVRFLVPVELYRPGSSKPEAPPEDYLTYLRGFTKANAQMSNLDKVTIDGRAATLIDLTWDRHGAAGSRRTAWFERRALKQQRGRVILTVWPTPTLSK